MKKTIAKILWVVLAVSLLPVALFGITAGAATEGYYTYTVSNGKATITDFSGYVSGDIVIPSTLGGVPVTSIGSMAFSGCTRLTGITIPNSVTSIGYGVFSGCTGLTGITISDGVTSIGGRAFSDCTGLTEITVDSNNQAYTSEDGVLFNKDKTQIVCCPAGKSGAYTNPDSVTSIGDYAFSGCTGLTGITIPNSVTSIGDYAFYRCTGLTEITIPDSVTSIGSYAFFFCTGLTSITIPDSVTSIGSSAFSGCAGLTKITIPDSVNSIGSSAFYGCTGLTEIIVDSNNQAYTSEDGVLFNKDKTKIVRCPAGKSGAYTVPDSVTSIGDEAFRGCTGLTEITIPDSVTSIGDDAFVVCTGLTSITIGDSVTSIGSLAFSVCTGLTSITIPNSVTSIGDYAFSGCTGLTEITIPFVGEKADGSGVSHFGYLFGADKASNNGSAVPSSLRKVTITGSNSIGDQAFYGCTGLTEITIPDSITSIGDEAFRGCTGLTSITIPNSVTSIGSSAFRGCTGLTSLTLPFVGEKADGSGDSSFKFIFDSSVPTSLKTVTVTGSNSLASHAFEGCSSLQNLRLVGDMKVLGDSALVGCTGLRDITLPASCLLIGPMNFYDCVHLNDVYFLGTKAQRKMEIGDSNVMIDRIALWHYNSCYGTTEHSYEDGDICTVCGCSKNLIQAINLMEALPEEITSENAQSVVAARQAFDKLTEEQKALVPEETLAKLTAAEEALAQPEITYGDADGDGEITAKDALMALQHTVKLITMDEVQFAAADTDGNGAVDAKDALLVLQYVVKLIDSFPAKVQ